MIDPAEALERLVEGLEPLPSSVVDLGEAHGRILAESIVADRDFPATDRSAMDGFAVRSADVTSAGAVLRVIGEIRAGQAPADLVVGPGETARIMTGAVVPSGADAVVMVEKTREEPDGSVRIEEPHDAGRNIRRRAEDRTAGDLLLEPGAVIQAPEMAVLASVGRTRPRVHGLPVVHVLSTGDEIVGPSETPAEHQVRNSNGATLLAQLAETGIAGRSLGIAGDEEGALGRALARGLEGDLLLVTGGVSVGAYDLVRAGLEAAGLEVAFHGVRVKPGKPILAGRCAGCRVVGLPGNPVSTYVGFAVFVAPMLRRLMGYAAWENVAVSAVLGERMVVRPGRETYHLARVDPAGDALVARPVASRGSGDVLSLCRANALVHTSAAGGTLDPGTRVEATLWAGFAQRPRVDR